VFSFVVHGVPAPLRPGRQLYPIVRGQINLASDGLKLAVKLEPGDVVLTAIRRDRTPSEATVMGVRLETITIERRVVLVTLRNAQGREVSRKYRPHDPVRVVVP